MTWDGTWKPTIPLSRHEHTYARMFGIADITIDGQQVRCTILRTRRGQTFARIIDEGRWFQLIKS